MSALAIEPPRILRCFPRVFLQARDRLPQQISQSIFENRAILQSDICDGQLCIHVAADAGDEERIIDAGTE
jgi:hypothetical protein